MSTTRNAPCPCGSGRKYKHCCGRAAAESMPTEARAAGQQHEAARDAFSTLCHSRERDAALRRMLETAAGGLLAHRDTTAMPMSRAQLRALANQFPQGLTHMDEAQMADLERQVIGPMILKWAEVTIPALDDRTPRETVKTVAGRQAVADLIDDWEAMVTRGGKQFGAEFNALRRSLGLTEA